MGNKIWYHGSSEAFEKFDPKFIGNGIDQHGVGHYFTEDKSVAQVYAGLGFLYSVNLEENGAMVVNEKGICIENKPSISKKSIKELITSAPDFKETIWNFGDIGSREEHLDEVVRDAVETYHSIGEPMNIFNSLANDFYRGEEGSFALKLKQLIKIPGIEVRGNGVSRIFVAFDADDIKLLGAPQNMQEIQSVLKEDHSEETEPAAMKHTH